MNGEAAGPYRFGPAPEPISSGAFSSEQNGNDPVLIAFRVAGSPVTEVASEDVQSTP